jgi:16S rRNA (cytosine1402-N4)-methyltransferase
MTFHKPILLKETIEGLKIVPDGVYVDMTYGGGGHSGAILNKLGANGRLVSFDQDVDALKNRVDDGRLTLIRSNFRYAHKYLRLLGLDEVEGVMADIGVSSFQFDESGRGFSYRFDAELDMRMNRDQEMSARTVLNEYGESDLLRIFSNYGEVRNSRQLARKIVEARKDAAINTGADLLKVLDQVSRGDKQRYNAQVFQAVRIEVNDELGALKEMLQNVGSFLRPGGRLVVLSFHSLEDRIVKRFIKTGNVEGKVVKDAYGVVLRTFKEVHKGVLTASDEERKENPRSNSAKLRIAEKL